MLRWITRRGRTTATFCDACQSVCDARCRHRTARDAHLDRALYLGGRR